MSTKTILIVYLIAALVIGGLLYWRNRTFQHAEHEFNLLACMLEAVATECLQEHDACASDSDSERATERLLQKYKQEGLLDYMEEDYETLERLVNRMARFSITAEKPRLLACHKRLILLDRALDACNFPAFCVRLTASTPGSDGFIATLSGARKRQ